MRLGWKLLGAVATLCVVGSGALVYVAYQTAPPSNSSTFIEVTKTIFLCLGGIGVLLPITLNVISSIEERQLRIIENTFSLLSRWDDANLLKARNYTRQIKKNKPNISDKDLVSQIQGDEELEQSVILVTNYFEHVRYSLKNGRIDSVTFKESLGATLVDIIERFWPYYETKPQAVCSDLKELKRLLE